MKGEYTPFIERTPDGQYKNLIREILEKGIKTPSRMVDKNGHEINTICYLGPNSMRFNILENGAPIITERDISFWRSAVGEIFAFINGVRTHEGLKEFGCNWWKNWVTEEKCAKRGLEYGDLGPGSYGAAFHDFPTPNGTFNQFKEIIKQMKENPELKTHLISPWIPEYTIRNSDNEQKVVVCPCHGWILFTIFDDKISMNMWQRSSDVLIGLPSNWAQYSALLLAVADVLDLQPYEFIHQIANAHIYEDQLPWVDEILSREDRSFPTLKLIKKHDELEDYRSSDFSLTDYHPHEAIKGIPVGV